MAAPPSAKSKEFRFRRLDKPEELRAVQELGRLVGGPEESPPVTVPIERLAQDHGGIVLGAFADIHLAGAVVSFLGWDGTELYQMIALAAVRPEYRLHGLGRRLLAEFRDEVVRQGLPLARGLIDPLDGRAAALGVNALGARVEKYRPHYFGTLEGPADRGLETDRLLLRWPLTDPAVVARLASRPPTAGERAPQWTGAAPLLLTEVTDHGLRRPAEVRDPSGDRVQLEIPFDLEGIREHEPATLRPWRHAVRDAFRGALDAGYGVEAFATIPLAHERRSFYFLQRGARTPPAPASGSGPPSNQP